MGSHRYCYVAPYEADLHSALQKLRLREFEAGRYDPALLAAVPPTYAYRQIFPPGPDFPSPGAQHASIDAALEASDESGTGSILDIFAISDRPSFFHATPISGEDTRALFGTSTPTRADLEALYREGVEVPPERMRMIEMYSEAIPRGQARVLVVYEANAPTALFFVGWSVD